MVAVTRPGFAEKIPLGEWAHLHAYLIWIYDGRVDAGGRSGTMIASHMTAWLLRSGGVDVRAGDQRFTARAGEWLFHPPGQVWRRFSKDARLLSVRFRANWPSGEELFSDRVGMRLNAAGNPELERTAQRLAKCVKREFPRPDTHLLDAPATLATHLRLQVLFATWLEASVGALTRAGFVPARMGHIDPRLLQAVQIVERHSLANRFSELSLAAEIGMSVSQLNRLFFRQFHVSSRGYFERRRQEHAVAALQSSARTVKEIAYQLGFSSLPHFSAWAKKHLGSSPRAYRETLG
jgi:AraC-like DNA-binding protein